MRICLVVSGLNGNGGMEQHIADLAGGLSREFEVHVIADYSFTDQFVVGVTHHKVPFTRSRFSPRLLYAVTKALRKIVPDLVHAHGAKAARVLSIVNITRRIPSVLTIHNNNPTQRLCAKFDRVIAVSPKINSQIQQPSVTTILNGRG